MKHNTESGFGAIGVIIIILVIGIIGAIGWFLLHKDKEATPTASTNTATKAEDTGTTSDAQTSGDTKFLIIKEWGVKMALTADTEDAYYDANTTSPSTTMNLRTHSLDAEADCKTGQLSVAGLFREPKDAEDSDQPGKKFSEDYDGQVIGDYFYFPALSQYNCTQNTSLLITLQGVRNSLATAGPSIVKL